MTEAEIRSRIIEVLAETVAALHGFEQKWTEDWRRRGWNPEEDINIDYCRMLIKAYEGWLRAEKEVLALEKKLEERPKRKRTKRHRKSLAENHPRKA
jgi:hypothetical protein